MYIYVIYFHNSFMLLWYFYTVSIPCRACALTHHIPLSVIFFSMIVLTQRNNINTIRLHTTICDITPIVSSELELASGNLNHHCAESNIDERDIRNFVSPFSDDARIWSTRWWRNSRDQRTDLERKSRSLTLYVSLQRKKKNELEAVS